MIDIIIDTLMDFIRLLPFLYIAFLIIELLEHKLSDKSEKIIKKSGKFGPLIGSVLGLFPQCGFGSLATNLYVTRIISLGTLISIYLSTSDEMLPILITSNISPTLIVEILLIKFSIGLAAGFIIDFILRKNKNKEKADYHICTEEHCNCEKENIFISSLKHTLNISLFMIITTLIINLLFSYLGEEYISKIFLKNSLLSPFISSLVGLIPNCGASVMITELYLNNAINFSSLISGLLTGSGVSMLILFKENKNVKENIKIIAIVYLIGSLVGVIIRLFGM